MQETLQNTLHLYASNKGDKKVRESLTVTNEAELEYAVGFIQALVDLDYFVINEFETSINDIVFMHDIHYST